jgi:hypothetical protein
MKTLSTIIFAGLMAFGVSACAKEEPKQAPVPVAQAEVKKEEPKIDAPKIKRVCKDTKDKKGKDVQVCKNIKIHKKHEGTKVPEKAPAKSSGKK